MSILLKRLEVENWRGLTSPVVIPFSETVTVIGGPNESGKSSLRQALRASLLLPSGARGEKKVMEAVRPWETRVFPRVSLIFEAGGDEWVVEKQFLRTKDWASLKRGGRLVAQDGEVGPMLRTALGPTAEWIDVLWGTQGEQVRDADLAVPESVKGRLAAAARETVTPAVAELEDRIRKEFDRFWTELRMSPKKLLQDARQEVILRENRVADVERTLAEADERTAALDAERARLAAKRAQIEEVSSTIEAGMASVGVWETYEKNVVEADSAKKAVEALERWMNAWDKLVTGAVELWPRSVAWRAQVSSLEARLGAAPSRTAIDDLMARLKFAELLLGDDERRRLEALRAPSAAELRPIQEAAAKLQEVAAFLSAAELQASLTASAALSVSLERDGDEPEVFDMQRDTTAEFTAERTFVMTLPGVAKLTVSSGDPRIAELVSQRDVHEAVVEAALERFEVRSVDALVERAREAEGLTQSLAARKFSAAALEAARARVGDAGAVEALGVEGWRGLLERLPGEIEAAEKAWQGAQDEHSRLAADHRKLSGENLDMALRHALDQLRGAIAQAPVACILVVPAEADAAFIEGLGQAAWQRPFAGEMARLVEERRRKEAAAVRPEGEVFNRDRLDKLQEERRLLVLDAEQINARVQQSMGAIQAQGDLYGQKVAAVEDLERARMDAARVELDAQSIRALLLAFTNARDRLQANVVAPLQARVSERLSELTRGGYRGVAYDAAFRVSGIVPARATSAPPNDLSLGTLEQLMLLTRLCLGEMLSEDGKQVLVLDDNLVHTDEGRMALACEMLEGASRCLQIVIFTCHPERYKFAGPVQRIELGPTGG